MTQRAGLRPTAPLTDLTDRSVISVTRARARTVKANTSVRSVRTGKAQKAKAEMLLREAASVVAARRKQYSSAPVLFGQVACRWSVTLGHPVTPVQAVLCMIELKLARLASNPRHRGSAIDIAGYVALLDEVI